MGKTQRAVTDLFAQSIAEAAAVGPTIVLLDEVETLAADRTKLSLEANPVDVHRATDAVLVQLDELAEDHSKPAVSRDEQLPPGCRQRLHLPLRPRGECTPSRTVRPASRSSRTAWSVSARRFRRSRSSSHHRSSSGALPNAWVSTGGAIRKMVASALASSHQTAMKPERVTIDDLLAAARAAKAGRNMEGKAP